MTACTPWCVEHDVDSGACNGARTVVPEGGESRHEIDVRLQARPGDGVRVVVDGDLFLEPCQAQALAGVLTELCRT